MHIALSKQSNTKRLAFHAFNSIFFFASEYKKYVSISRWIVEFMNF